MWRSAGYKGLRKRLVDTGLRHFWRERGGRVSPTKICEKGKVLEIIKRIIIKKEIGIHVQLHVEVEI